MELKEISVFKERKVNIGNYETVGLSVGLVATTSDEYYEVDYNKLSDMIDAKLEYFVDKWKNPKKIVDKMTKENMQKYKDESPF